MILVVGDVISVISQVAVLVCRLGEVGVGGGGLL